MGSDKKTILIHTLIFSPDGVSTAYLYNDIARAFQKRGYDVVVLSTTPHFNVVNEQLAEQPMKWGIWGWYKKSLFNGIRWASSFKFPVTSSCFVRNEVQHSE